MRKRILQVITLLLAFALVFYFVDILIIKKDIIANIIKVVPLSIFFISILILLVTNEKQHLIPVNNIIVLSICIQVLFLAVNPTITPSIWNYILALVVLLGGVNLIGSIKNHKLIFVIPIGIAIIFLEFILLFKVEQELMFTIAFILLLITTLVSLLAVFSNK